MKKKVEILETPSEYTDNKRRVTIVEVPQMRNGGTWGQQYQGGLATPYPLSYDAKPYQEKDPEYRMKNTLSPVTDIIPAPEMGGYFKKVKK